MSVAEQLPDTDRAETPPPEQRKRSYSMPRSGAKRIEMAFAGPRQTPYIESLKQMERDLGNLAYRKYQAGWLDEALALAVLEERMCRRTFSSRVAALTRAGRLVVEDGRIAFPDWEVANVSQETLDEYRSHDRALSAARMAKMRSKKGLQGLSKRGRKSPMITRLSEPVTRLQKISPSSEGESTHKTEASELRSSLAPGDATRPRVSLPTEHPSEFVRTSAPRKTPPAPCTDQELDALADEFDALDRGEVPAPKQDPLAPLSPRVPRSEDGPVPGDENPFGQAWIEKMRKLQRARDIDPPKLGDGPKRAAAPLVIEHPSPAPAALQAVNSAASASPLLLSARSLTIAQVDHLLEQLPRDFTMGINRKALANAGPSYDILRQAVDIASERRKRERLRSVGGFIVGTMRRLEKIAHASGP
jgi:hypothetical protein